MKQDWLNLERFWAYSREQAIDPSLRLLLTSSGTVIRHLKAMTLQSIEVEIERQGEILINDDLSEKIGISTGEQGFERRIWLRSSSPPRASTHPQERKAQSEAPGTRLLYAVSTFPVYRLKPDLYREMLIGGKPLGGIIEERRLQTFRDRLEISRLSSPSTAKGLGLPPESLFWARRYRINISDQAIAFIVEVFSPRLSSSSS